MKLEEKPHSEYLEFFKKLISKIMKKSKKEVIGELYSFIFNLDQYSKEYIEDKIASYSVSKLHYKELMSSQSDRITDNQRRYVTKKLLIKIPIEELSLEMIMSVLNGEEEDPYRDGVLRASVDMAKKFPCSNEEFNLLKIIFNQKDWRYSGMYLLIKFAEKVLDSKYRKYLVTNGDQILGFKSNLGLAYDYIDSHIL